MHYIIVPSLNAKYERCTHSEVELGKCQSEKSKIPYYLINGILTILPMAYRPPLPYPWYFDPLTHGISNGILNPLIEN
jgi:hypothetical protein